NEPRLGVREFDPAAQQVVGLARVDRLPRNLKALAQALDKGARVGCDEPSVGDQRTRRVEKNGVASGALLPRKNPACDIGVERGVRSSEILNRGGGESEIGRRVNRGV